MKVLLGVGGGEDSVRALERTTERAREAGDEVTVAVLDTDGERTPEETETLVSDHFAAADVDAEVRRLSGDPGSTLVELAESEAFDELVIGGGTRSPMGKIQFSPLEEFVLLNAHVSVTLVR